MRNRNNPQNHLKNNENFAPGNRQKKKKRLRKKEEITPKTISGNICLYSKLKLIVIFIFLLWFVVQLKLFLWTGATLTYLFRPTLIDRR